MRLSEQIKPISYFKNNAAKAIAEITETREPLIITQNGEASCVMEEKGYPACFSARQCIVPA